MMVNYKCRCGTEIRLSTEHPAWTEKLLVECQFCHTTLQVEGTQTGTAMNSLVADVKDLEARAQSIREFLADMDPDDAGSVMLAVAAEKAIAESIDPETFGRMAEALALALIATRKGGTA